MPQKQSHSFFYSRLSVYRQSVKCLVYLFENPWSAQCFTAYHNSVTAGVVHHIYHIFRLCDIAVAYYRNTYRIFYIFYGIHINTWCVHLLSCSAVHSYKVYTCSFHFFCQFHTGYTVVVPAFAHFNTYWCAVCIFYHSFGNFCSQVCIFHQCTACAVTCDFWCRATHIDVDKVRFYFQYQFSCRFKVHRVKTEQLYAVSAFVVPGFHQLSAFFVAVIQCACRYHFAYSKAGTHVIGHLSHYYIAEPRHRRQHCFAFYIQSVQIHFFTILIFLVYIVYHKILKCGILYY